MSFTFDFESLRKEIIEATIRAYQEISKELGDDSIAGICLRTDDGAMTVAPSFASKTFFDHDPSIIFQYNEWPITHGADHEFNAICDRLAGYVVGSTESVTTLRSQVLANLTCACEEVRKNLSLNDSIVILVGVSEGSSEDLRAAERVKRLNSEQIYEDYLQTVENTED